MSKKKDRTEATRKSLENFLLKSKKKRFEEGRGGLPYQILQENPGKWMIKSFQKSPSLYRENESIFTKVNEIKRLLTPQVESRKIDSNSKLSKF